MGEWWTYGLSDFLMFSPRTYARLVALYHGHWPAAQALGLAGGVAALALAGAARRRPAALSLLLLLQAAAWAWVGWAFAWERYATINLAAPYLALACGLQALLCMAVAARPGAAAAGDGLRLAGFAIAVGAIVGWPAAVFFSGRPWSGVEVAGTMPDPTALASLGLWAAAGPRWRLLLPLPAAVLAFGLATRWAMAG